MTDFFQFMANRARNLPIATPNSNVSIDVMHAAAKKAARRDRSDPFVYGRAMNGMKTGRFHPTDFNVPVSV